MVSVMLVAGVRFHQKASTCNLVESVYDILKNKYYDIYLGYTVLIYYMQEDLTTVGHFCHSKGSQVMNLNEIYLLL